MISTQIIIVLAILGLAVVLFVTEIVSLDISALIIMSSLLLTDILTPQESISGFSNEATITIAAMFVLSEGIYRTGALDIVGTFFIKLGKNNYWLAMISMMLMVGIISAFINNTATVAIFIPIVIMVCNRLNISPSKMLMPLSFASMFGGVSTLIGTSTNLLVSSIAQNYGEAAFTMFEFTPLGIIFLIVGLTYLLLIGIRLIPERRSESEATAGFVMNEYLTDIILEPGFAHINKNLDEFDLIQDLDLDVLQVFNAKGELATNTNQAMLKTGDVLRIRGNAKEIKKLMLREDISLKRAKKLYDGDLQLGKGTLVEAVIAPDSDVVGQEIDAVNFPERFGAVVLALRHHGKLQQDALGKIKLSGGDSILLMMDRDRVQSVEKEPAFVVASELGLPEHSTKKMPIAISIVVGVVLATIFQIASIMLNAIIGSILLVITGCITTEEAYKAINWKIILLLAGILPLGLALEKTGTAELIANSVLSLGGNWGPIAILSAFFFLSMTLTEIISNQATAVLLAPIAIQTAQTLDVSSRPFLVAVTFAASLSFMTPVGYQTNTLVYGPGQYKFTDFTKVGGPLNIIFWIISTLTIPLIWHF